MFTLEFELISLLAISIYLAIIIFLMSGYRSQVRRQNTKQVKVSVVVAARNEAKNLSECLPFICNQDYPADLFEIIVVNDRSSDQSAEILKTFLRQYHNLRTVEIEPQKPHLSPKKNALTAGIAVASGEIILTTDADCRPQRGWLAQMVQVFSDDVGLAAGFAPFDSKQGIFNALQQLENFAAAFVAAGGIGLRVGITCTGRNLAYRKNLFYELDGFAGIEKSMSGDDDLFLQQVTRQTAWNVAYNKNKNASVESAPAKNFRKYLRQRRRHVSAAKFYPRNLQLGYLLFNLANLWLWIASLVAFMIKIDSWIILSAFACKILVDFWALFSVAKELNKTSVLRFFLLWECFHLVDKALISPLGFIGRLKWK